MSSFQLFHVIAELDEYALTDEGCLPSRYEPGVIHSLYVEVTFSGCKRLCERLHDDTCSQIVFLSHRRSCYLQPPQELTLTHASDGCIVALVYRRHRRIC